VIKLSEKGSDSVIERKEIVPMFQAIDMMHSIKLERSRLEHKVNSEDFSKNTSWGWMTEWLEKSDEEHLIEGMEIYRERDKEKDLGNYVCHICFTPNRYLLTTTFSIGDGYGHKMQICSNCGEKIGELAKQLEHMEKQVD